MARAARSKREFWSSPQSRTFAELLIECEEDWVLRAVLVRMLREASWVFPALGAPAGLQSKGVGV
jgi:hypothetical protein